MDHEPTTDQTPGPDVCDDLHIRTVAQPLTIEQLARIAALKAAQEVIARRSGGPFNTATREGGDPVDLIAVANYILTGQDPWPSDAAAEQAPGTMDEYEALAKIRRGLAGDDPEA